MLCAHVISAGVPGSGASAYQLFKMTLVALRDTDFATQKLVFGKAAPVALAPEEHNLFTAALMSESGELNYFWRIGSHIGELQDEARGSVAALEAEADPFDSVFGVRVGLEARCDVFLKIQATHSEDEYLIPYTDRQAGRYGACPLADATTVHALALRALAVFRAGLSDRATQYCVRVIPPTQLDQPTGLVIGIRLDPSHATRVLDRGPEADSPQTAEFRRLWGDRAVLRRFKDASILECVVWAEPKYKKIWEDPELPYVPHQMLLHLMELHFKELVDTPGLDGGENVNVLHTPLGINGPLCDAHTALWQQFAEMKEQLEALETLPIAVKEARPSSSGFSYSDLSPEVWIQPPSRANDPPRTLHDAVLEFESSSAWPRAPAAVLRLQTAFLLKIQAELRSQHAVESLITPEYLDVLYPRFVFRLRIFTLGELYEMSTWATVDATLKTRPTWEQTEKIRRVWWGPHARSLLRAVSLIHICSGPTMRLVKKWLASQLVAGYDDLAELLVVQVFTTPGPYAHPPGSPHAAMLRVLALLASFDWAGAPMFVDLDDTFSPDHRHELQLAFERAKGMQGPMPSMWVATKLDPHMLFLRVPPAGLVHRVVALARGALDIATKATLALGDTRLQFRSVFEPDLSTFDAVIHIARAGGRDGAGVVYPQTPEELERMERAAHVETFVTKLREHLDQACHFFPAPQVGRVCVQFKSQAFLPAGQKGMLSSLPRVMVADGETPVTCPNVLWIISLIRRLGKDLVTRVELQ